MRFGEVVEQRRQLAAGLRGGRDGTALAVLVQTQPPGRQMLPERRDRGLASA
jgi:hypothetical protein